MTKSDFLDSIRFHADCNRATSFRCRYVNDIMSDEKILELIDKVASLDSTPLTKQEAIEYVLDYAEACMEYQDSFEFDE